MSILKLIFTIFITLCFKKSNGLEDFKNNAFIQEIDIGKNAILTCKSNNGSHLFLFWHIQRRGMIISPRNVYDETKYGYDGISGNLTIRGTTLDDEGIISCYSEGLKNKDFLVSSVHLVIHKDWEEVYETDPNTNLLRACVALTIILGMLIIVYMVMRLRQTHKKVYLHFDEPNEDEDDSTEELFNRGPSTSGHKKTVSQESKTPDDFEKVYTTITMTDTV